MDDLLADFLTETNESISELDVALVTLERTPDDGATLSLIFRLVHTIKGTCGFLGLPRLERVAHAAENVLGRVRDKVLPVTPDLVSAVLAAIDRIKLIVGNLAATQLEPVGDDAPLIAVLDAVSEGRAAAPPAPPVPPAPVAKAAPPPPEPVAAPPEPAPVPPAEPAPEIAGAAPRRSRSRRRGAGQQPDHPGRRRRARGTDDPGQRAGADPQPAAAAGAHPRG